MKAILPILALTVLPLLGCVIIPVPTAEHNYCDRSLAGNCDKFKTRGEIAEQTLEFMRPGATTREETLLTLGGPDSVWNNESTFAYQWLMVGGYAFIGVAGAAGANAWFKNYVLLLEFDAVNVVKRCEVLSIGLVKQVDGQKPSIDRELIDKWLASGRSESAETCIRSG
jgi:hypothetical protein